MADGEKFIIFQNQSLFLSVLETFFNTIFIISLIIAKTVNNCWLIVFRIKRNYC